MWLSKLLLGICFLGEVVESIMRGGDRVVTSVVRWHESRKRDRDLGGVSVGAEQSYG
jgi:hypothetical protein